MKKIVIFLALTISFSKTNIDFKNLKTYDFDSKYDIKIEKLEKELLKKQEEDFSNINFSSSIDYSTESGKTLNNTSLSYFWFKYDFGINLTDKKIYTSNLSINKTLNDYLYDKNFENNFKFEYDKLNLILEKEKEIDDFLNTYKKYLLKKRILELNEYDKNKYEKELEILNETYNLGKISKHDYNLAKDNLNLFNLKYLIDLEELKTIQLELKEKNFEFDDNIVFEFDKNDKLLDDEIRNYVEKVDILIEKYNIDKLKMEYNKINIENKYPKVNAYASYDILKKSYNVGMSINKNFEFIYLDDLSYELDELLRREKKLELLQERKFREYKDRYSYLVYKYIENEYNLRNLEDEYNIVAKKYELGNEKYIKLIEKRNELIKSKASLEESKIDLTLFISKIRRGN